MPDEAELRLTQRCRRQRQVERVIVGHDENGAISRPCRDLSLRPRRMDGGRIARDMGRTGNLAADDPAYREPQRRPLHDPPRLPAGQRRVVAALWSAKPVERSGWC